VCALFALTLCCCCICLAIVCSLLAALQLHIRTYTLRRVVLLELISQVFYYLLPASIMYTCYLQCAVQLNARSVNQPIQGSTRDNSLLMFEVNFHADVVGDCAEFVLIAASLWRSLCCAVCIAGFQVHSPTSISDAHCRNTQQRINRNEMRSFWALQELVQAK
jgi:hypothetical protein